MVLLKPEAEFGRCCPPETDFGVTTNLAGWETSVKLREGDMSDVPRFSQLYPRFMPWNQARQLMEALHGKLQLSETQGLLAWTHPSNLAYVLSHATKATRDQFVLSREELSFKCVRVGATRLFVVVFPAAKTVGVILTWCNAGTGVSLRLARDLLPQLDQEGGFEVVDGDVDPLSPPDGTFLPETDDHAAIRERITGLYKRAARDEALVEKLCPEDVFLYNTGMAGLTHLQDLLVQRQKGRVVMLGSMYHNTYHHAQDELGEDFVHFGKANGEGVDELEAWLDKETQEGRRVSYLLTEIPSNPLLATADLWRLKKLSEKHDFVFVVDDTVASFCNLDLFPVADVLVNSLTKSFSGYADVMGGSVTLNPSSRRHGDLSSLWGSAHRNELYSADAATLLANSADYLARSQVINRNARAMADFIHSHAAKDPSSPVARVLYPTLLPDCGVYESFLRRPSGDFPEPGFGGLLSVDFATKAAAVAFYETLGFYPGPHLGGHKTLSFCYNTLAFGHAHEAGYHRSYGVLEESVRISAGLEDVEDLIDTLREGLDAAKRAGQEELEK